MIIKPPRRRLEYSNPSRFKRVAFDLGTGLLVGMALVTLLIVAFVVIAALGQWFNNRIPDAPREQAALPDAPVLTVPVSAASPTALLAPTSAMSSTSDAFPPAVSATQPQVVNPAPVNPDIASEATRIALSGNPLAAYSIPALAVYPYNGGTIVRQERFASVSSYSQWSFSYQSDGLTVTGLMDIPTGPGPWPVILVLHGGIDQSSYRQGDDTRGMADVLARSGYLALMPDYRSYNNTDGSGSPLKIPWAIDVMNLIQALPTLPEADPNRIGVLGHSRGGGVASSIMVLSRKVSAVVLYAPLSTNQATVWDIYNTKFGSEWPSRDALVYGSPSTNPEGYQMVSPSTYLNWVTAPIQIHHGTDDVVLPFQWSEELQASLQALGKKSELFVYEGAGHTFVGADYEKFMQRSIAFFDQYVKSH